MQCGSGNVQLCSLIVGCFSIFTASYISVHVDQQMNSYFRGTASRHVTRSGQFHHLRNFALILTK